MSGPLSTWTMLNKGYSLSLSFLPSGAAMHTVSFARTLNKTKHPPPLQYDECRTGYVRRTTVCAVLYFGDRVRSPRLSSLCRPQRHMTVTCFSWRYRCSLPAGWALILMHHTKKKGQKSHLASVPPSLSWNPVFLIFLIA